MKGRLLGASQMAEAAFTAQVIVNGNNLRLGGDIPGRTYMVKLDARTSRPFLREGFRQADLIGWAQAHRAELLTAFLTAARAWFVAGQPAGDHRLGGFEEWARIVGGVLAYGGVDGFLAAHDEMWDEADDDGP